MGADDLSVIEGEAVFVTVKGTRYAFGALKVGQLPAVARSVKPMLPALGPLLNGEFRLDSLIDLVADHGDAMIDALSIATKIPREVLADCGVDELLAVLPLVLQVNKDFLLRRLLARPAANHTSPGAGPTP